MERQLRRFAAGLTRQVRPRRLPWLRRPAAPRLRRTAWPARIVVEISKPGECLHRGGAKTALRHIHLQVGLVLHPRRRNGTAIDCAAGRHFFTSCQKRSRQWRFRSFDPGRTDHRYAPQPARGGIFVSFFRPQGKRLSVKKVGEFKISLYSSSTYFDDLPYPKTLKELENHAFIDFIEDHIYSKENAGSPTSCAPRTQFFAAPAWSPSTSRSRTGRASRCCRPMSRRTTGTCGR